MLCLDLIMGFEWLDPSIVLSLKPFIFKGLPKI